jgi:hypothetical protein
MEASGGDFCLANARHSVWKPERTQTGVCAALRREWIRHAFALTVGDFVSVKAPEINRDQSTSTTGCKRFNQNQLRTTEIHRVQ